MSRKKEIKARSGQEIAPTEAKDDDSSPETTVAQHLPVGRAAFAARLSKIIWEFKSARELAEVAGISPNSISLWLHCLASPSRDNLVKLAAAAQVSIGWLAAGEGEMNPFLPPAGFRLPAGTTVGPELAFTDRFWERLALPFKSTGAWLSAVNDDAMEPTLHVGDLILYEPRHSHQVGFSGASGIYILEGGEIRRIEWRIEEHQRQVGVISCDNPAYHASTRISHFKKIRLKGKIFWRGGRI